jgi:phosphopantetheine--protein transferase-like protein
MGLQVKIGCDIVQISKFEERIQQSNSTLLSNLFSSYELNNAKSIKSLAGLFAAKEAIVKALQLNPGNWSQIEIFKLESGKPTIKLNFDKKISSHDISISHDGDYAFATACFLIE